METGAIMFIIKEGAVYTVPCELPTLVRVHNTGKVVPCPETLTFQSRHDCIRVYGDLLDAWFKIY